ncbi:MAG: hypothetical protein ACI9R3_001877 [Verrucomicrobiales bacterium]|jgi:hypothetical protein
MCPGVLPAAPFISEFLASNGTTIMDEDGQASDWIEVYNPDAQPVRLAGFHLTDDPDTLTKWTFPDVTLGSRGYMIVWASGKNRLGTELHTNFGLSGNGEYLALVAPDGETILSEFPPEFPPQILDTSYGGGLATTRATVLALGSAVQWHVPEGDTAGWANADFDDAGWIRAASGIGFGYGDLVGVNGDTKRAMQAINGSIYTRFPFEISNPGSVVSMTLRMKFEDGFVAFLNGFEIASFNAPEIIEWNSIASGSHPDAEAEQFVDFEIPFGGHLIEGSNVLAIQGLNATVGGSDLLILPELTVQMQSGEVTVGYLLEPTPGAVNTSSFSSPPLPPSFSSERGYYDAPFELSLSTDDPDTDIFYTTDGGIPSVSDGSMYSAPLAISKTTVIRAVTVRDGKAVSQATTHTYLFTADILEQSGFNGRNNRLITSDDVYGPLMVESLRSIPAVCLSANRRLPTASESETSIELFDPAGGEQGFQVDCGIKLVGGASTGSPKNNFRLYFRGIYGATKLRYPLFKGHPYSEKSADEFDILQLRSGSHDNFFWLALPSNPPVGNRHGDAQYVRNRWIADMQFLMGQESLHGRFVQLYVNGQYHGLYHFHERSMPGYLASYLGGEPEDYHYTNSARTGSDHGGGDRWSATWSQMKSSISSYEDAKEMIDVENLADYMLLNFYAGNTWDWTAQHNWMAGGPKESGRGGWKFFCWDSDIMLQDVRNNAVAIDVPDGVFHRLLNHDDFRVLMRDRIYKFCFNDGLLTPDKVAAVYNYRMEEIFVPIVAETARWQPSSATRLPWDRDGEWMTEWNHFKEVWFPQRTEILLDQLRATRVRGAALYPVETPEFLQRGGLVAPGYAPRLTTASGAIYYTTDGSDPRLPGGDIAPGARAFAGGTRPVTVVPRGSIWKFPDDGVDLGTSWRVGGFDDSHWNEGAGQLGYGERDEVTVIESNGAGGSKSPTNYFRLAFDVASPEKMSDLSIELLRDDGAVVYLNGSEVIRDNLPEGVISFETLAVDGLTGAAESDYLTFDIPANLLIGGRNLLAVEVHQNSPGSSDLSFDLGLLAKEATGAADIVIESPTTIRARALEGDEWSALNEATFSVTTSPPASMASVLLTEIHYNPSSDADTEFLEFKNVAELPVDFSNVVVSGAIDYVFPTGTLLPVGELIVVVGDLAKFNALHQNAESPWAAEGALFVVGPWSGKLSNSGESLIVTAADGAQIFDFQFGDSGAWPERADGHGSSLELRLSNVVLPSDLAERNNYFADPNHWQSSIAYLGSPGRASGAAPGIVVNEVLADGQAGAGDQVELYNATTAAIDISGWLLSDDTANLGRFKIPAGSVVPPGGFFTISETEGLFGLSSRSGDEVFLVRADTDGNPLQFSDQVDFGVSARGESFGRWPDGAGSLYPMKLATFGELNITDGNAPRVGPVVISEVHYNPDGPDENLEFVTVLNTATSEESLANWQLRGEVDFNFSSETVLVPGASIRLVAFDPLDPSLASLFNESHGFDSSIPLVGPWSDGAKLNDGGGAVHLYRRIAAAEPDDVRLLIEDSVNYSDGPDWPEAADGSGAWLVRANPSGLGDKGSNWQASTATGGNSFTQWAMTAFPKGTPTEAMLPSADFDNDGITNFAEYAFLLDPSATDSYELLTAVVHVDGKITLSHIVRIDDPTLSYLVRGSSDLINWFDDVQRFTIESEAAVTNVSALRTIRFVEQPTDALFRFFRVEVSGTQ